MSYNFKNVKSGSTGNFEALPTDRYEVKVDNAVVVRTNADDADMIKLRLVVTEGTFAGRMCFDQVTFKDNSLWRIKSLLELIDSPLVDGTDVSPQEVALELEGKPYSVYVEKELNNRQVETNNVKNYSKSTKLVSTGQKSLFS